MQIDIQSGGIRLGDALREHARRRTLFALSRLSDRILRVVIRLSDVNGPRGGVDKRCSVQVHLLNSAPAIIEDVAGDFHAVLDRALGRAGRLVSKRVDRGMHVQRAARGLQLTSA